MRVRNEVSYKLNKRETSSDMQFYCLKKKDSRKKYLVQHANAKEVHNHQINCQGLAQKIIQPRARRGHACFQDCLQEVGLVVTRKESSRLEFVIVP